MDECMRVPNLMLLTWQHRQQPTAESVRKSSRWYAVTQLWESADALQLLASTTDLLLITASTHVPCSDAVVCAAQHLEKGASRAGVIEIAQVDHLGVYQDCKTRECPFEPGEEWRIVKCPLRRFVLVPEACHKFLRVGFRPHGVTLIAISPVLQGETMRDSHPVLVNLKVSRPVCRKQKNAGSGQRCNESPNGVPGMGNFCVRQS